VWFIVYSHIIVVEGYQHYNINIIEDFILILLFFIQKINLEFW
jgi:hypothetical protein